MKKMIVSRLELDATHMVLQLALSLVDALDYTINRVVFRTEINDSAPLDSSSNHQDLCRSQNC